MASSDRIGWDAVYRERMKDDYPDPDPLLYQFTPPLRMPNSASALDVAAGVGQNGLWLAAQGYIVDLVEISRVALTRAREEAARRDLRSVNFFQLDLDDGGLETATYDLACVFRYLSRSLMPQIRAAVKPGGRIIYQTFNKRYLEIKPDMNPAYLLSPGELAGFFGDWRVVHHREADHVSQIVAIKPGR